MDIAEQTRRRVAWRLMPFIFLLYIVSYLDRVNVGFAALQMRRELGLSGAVFGIGGGIFLCRLLPAGNSRRDPCRVVERA